MLPTTQRLRLTTLQAVKAPRAARKFAYVLGVLFLLLPIALTTVPWRQNVQAQGRVTALDPLDRNQIIPAPVTGRLGELLVQEGDYVEEGRRISRPLSSIICRAARSLFKVSGIKL